MVSFVSGFKAENYTIANFAQYAIAYADLMSVEQFFVTDEVQGISADSCSSLEKRLEDQVDCLYFVRNSQSNRLMSKGINTIWKAREKAR